MDTLSLPGTPEGGDAIGELSENLLDALNREQGQLGNLQPGERFSLAGGVKSSKAIFAMAEEDDDDDFFKEFGVEDLDNEQIEAELPPSSAGAHEPSMDAMNTAAEAGTPPDLPCIDTGPQGMATVAQPLQEAPTPQDVTHAAEEANATRASSQNDMAHSADDMPAAPAGGMTLQPDAVMQDALEAIAADAVQAAAPEVVIPNMQTVSQKLQGAHHDAQGHSGSEAEGQVQHVMQASRQPEGAERAMADMLMQEASQPPHAQQAAPICADTCMQDAAYAADGGINNTHCADLAMHNTSQLDEAPQQHSTRAQIDVVDVHTAAEASVGQQECMPMHEAALSAGTVGLQPASRGADQAPVDPVAAAALQANATQSEAIMPGMGADSAPDELMRPSSAGIVTGEMQLAPVAPETLARSASAPLLSKDCPEAIPAETATVVSVEEHVAVPEGDLMPVKPSPGTAMHQASAHQVLPQHQPADDSTVLPDPVQQQAGVVPQMRQPQTSSQERPQHLRTVPIQPGQPLGSPVLAPSLQPRIATPYNALSGLKVAPRVLPMPRTGLARLPQIIRPHAPAIQLPASAAAAATQGPRAPSPSSAQPLGYPPVSAAPTTAPFSGFPQAFSATPVVPISDTQVASGALQSSKTPYGIRLPSLTPAPMQRLSLHAGSTEPIGLPRGAALSTSPPVQGTVPGISGQTVSQAQAAEEPCTAALSISTTIPAPSGHTMLPTSAAAGTAPPQLSFMNGQQTTPQGAASSSGQGAAGATECDTVMSEPAASAPAGCTQEQAEQAMPAQPEDLPEVHSLNLELLKSQRKLEQMLEEAQHMTDQALELQVMAAILGNRLTRLNNPMLAAKLKEMKQRAEVILAGEE